MVYKRSKKSYSSRRKSSYRRPKTTLRSLQKQVKTLQKKTKTITERDQYAIVEGIDVVGNYVARNLCNYSGWDKVWTSTGTAVDNVRSSMYHRRILIDNNVTLDNINNEEGEIRFTYFIVSRRDTASTATDTVNSLSLTDAVDYAFVNGMAMMNLKKWKVHYVKRFTLTGGDGADMQADQCKIRFQCYIKPNVRVTNPDGNWKALTNSPDPSDTFYALLFSDNSSVDLENPRWTMSVLHSIDH